MKEIIERLHENRQIELAKSILESHGYTVSKELTETTESDISLESKLKDAGLSNIRRTRTGLACTKSENFKVEDLDGFKGFVGETLDGLPVYKIEHQGVLWYVKLGTPNNLSTITINTTCPKVIYY